MSQIWSVEKALVLLTNQAETLSKLESRMLELSASRCTSSTLYCLVLKHKGDTVVRYLESGNLSGFMEHCGQDLLRPLIGTSKYLAYKIYTDGDVLLKRKHQEEITRNKSAAVKGDLTFYIKKLISYYYTHTTQNICLSEY